MKKMKEHERSHEGSRREFAKRVAVTLIAAPIVTSMVHAQTPAKTKEAPAPPNPQTNQTQSKQPSPIAEAYLRVAEARFGSQVTPEQLEQIRKDLEGNVQVADRLRAVKLRNSDEPDFTFSAE